MGPELKLSSQALREIRKTSLKNRIFIYRSNDRIGVDPCLKMKITIQLKYTLTCADKRHTIEL